MTRAQCYAAKRRQEKEGNAAFYRLYKALKDQTSAQPDGDDDAVEIAHERQATLVPDVMDYVERMFSKGGTR